MTPIELNIDEPAIIPAPPEIASILGLAEGSSIVRRFRKRGAQQGDTVIPYRLAENFYPATLVDNVLLEQMQKDERFDVILAISEKYGKAPVRIHEDVIGRLPTNQEQQLLNITPQTPVLEVNRVNYAEDDTVVMVNKIIFVANLFVLSYEYTTGYWKK